MTSINQLLNDFFPKQIGIQTAPQPYYQPNQFGGMSAIPSPPAVLYNSSPMPSQYGHYERYIASAHYGTAGNASKNQPSHFFTKCPSSRC